MIKLQQTKQFRGNKNLGGKNVKVSTQWLEGNQLVENQTQKTISFAI